MLNRNKPQPTVCLAMRYLLLCATLSPQHSLAGQPKDWILSASAAQESVGLNLPVLALGQPDWPKYHATTNNAGRAFQGIHAEVNALHPSGWRVATFIRAQSWLEASADAVTIAAAEATSTNPPALRTYGLYAKSQSWSGKGILLGTPWWPLATKDQWQWQWQADFALLQLTQLRLAEMGGRLNYKGASAYDFDLWSQRSNTGITGRFLPASGDAGSGASLSLALQGQPRQGWQVAFRADDLTSTLQWNDLATDANTLVSANTTRTPDGYLEYAAYLKGRKTLQPITGHIAPRWQLTLQHALTADNSPGAALTWEMLRQAGINQTWLGWRSDPPTSNLPHLSLALEPNWPALKLQATWHGWRLMLATDGKRADTLYRGLELGWQTSF